MKINWSVQLTDSEDTKLTEGEGADCKPVTLGLLTRRALNIALDPKVDPAAKDRNADSVFELYDLAVRTKYAGDFSVPEVKKIKECLTRAFPSSWIVGQCIAFLVEDTSSAELKVA